MNASGLHNRKVNVFVVTLWGIALAGSGCASRPDSEVVFWALGVEGEQVAKLIPAFEQRNPGVLVRVQMIPWNAAHEKLLTAYASNSLPDLFQIGNTWVPEFQMLDALENLNPWLARSSTLRETSYFRGIWNTNVIDSSLYGVPWYVDTKVLFYRKDLLAAAGYLRPPETWNEWFDVCRKIVDRRIAEYGVFFSTNNEWVPQVVLALQNGSALLKENNMYGDFSDPRFRDAMHTFQRFFTEGLAPVKTAQVVNIYQGMKDRAFAMFISGPWSIGEFQKRMPDSLKDFWMTAPLPGPDLDMRISLAGGASLAISRTSSRKTKVWKLIEYLSEPDVQAEFYRVTGDLPARIEAWNSPLLANNRYAAAFFEQLTRVVATPKIPEWEQIAQKVRELTELITMGTMSVDNATAELDRAVNLILEKRRWMAAHAH
ncbi:MAG: sugar ABC transporter substrate-binding protein [Bacteroidota bacterium]